MPQKIDIHGLFIDPESITGLNLQKRIAVYTPVFYEIETSKPFFSRSSTPQLRKLRFDHLQPYGIILANIEQPDPSSFEVYYRGAFSLRVSIQNIGQASKKFIGHISELLKIEVSGDRQYRILQPGRIVKTTSIREIPAKVHLLNGQWVDVFKSSPGYDFQGGNPYAVTDVRASALLITTKEKNYDLYGAEVDVTNEDVISTYHALAEIYNDIQSKHDALLIEQNKKPSIQMPKIKLKLPFGIGKKEASLVESLPEPNMVIQSSEDELSNKSD